MTPRLYVADLLRSLALSVVLGAPLIALVLTLMQWSGQRWWLYAWIVWTAFSLAVAFFYPRFIAPLFNTSKPLDDGPVKAAVLQMAHANGVPVDNVYEVDSSRQTTRVSANVSGLFGTAAVRLNDNLLRRTSEAEVRAVMGHELGHYVMNHMLKTLALMTLVLAVGFYIAQAAMNACASSENSQGNCQSRVTICADGSHRK